MGSSVWTGNLWQCPHGQGERRGLGGRSDKGLWARRTLDIHAVKFMRGFETGVFEQPFDMLVNILGKYWYFFFLLGNFLFLSSKRKSVSLA